MTSISPVRPFSASRTFCACALTFMMLISPLAPLASARGRATVRQDAPNKHDISNRDDDGSLVTVAPPKPAPNAQDPNAPDAVNITASLVDAFPDPNGNGKAEPGDTITYTATITNSGTTDATGVQFNLTADSDTSLVPNSIQTQPIAISDTFTAFGNVRISTANGAANLLANDCDPDDTSPPCNTNLTASGPTTGPTSGSATVSSNGDFSYNPNPGFTGNDSFTYTIRDTGPDNIAGNADDKTDVGTVNITVGPTLVWFINNQAAAGGDGRITTPFNSIAAFNATAADDPGDIIFIYNGTGTYTGGITLLNTQKIIGNGFSLGTETGAAPIGSEPLPSAGSTPTIDNVGANIITLAQNNTLRGFNTGNSGAAGTDITGTSFGTLTVSNLSINGDGRALNLTTGTLAATVANVNASNTGANAGLVLNGVGGALTISGNTTITNPGGAGLDVTNAPASTTYNFGTASVSKNAGGIGVNIATNNASTATNFTSLTVTNSVGTCLSTNGGGTVNVTAGSITGTGTGITVTLTNTALGMTFTSVSSNGGANGIVMSGGTGSFTSGTTNLQNNAGIGLFMSSSAVAANFGNTTVNSSAGDAVDLSSNTGNITFADLDLTPDANLRGLDAQNNTGTITSSSGDIAATGATTLFINGPAGRTPLSMTLNNIDSTNATGTNQGVFLNLVSGNLTVNDATLATNIQNPNATGVEVTNTGAGTINFGNTTVSGSGNANVDDPGSGVRLTNNAGAITFGALNLTPDSGERGLYATDSDATAAGTITIASGTITTTNDVAIEITGQASGNRTPLNIQLTAVNTSGGTNGMLVQDTNGALTVNGTGTTDGTGGTIQSTTGRGASFINAAGITLKNMTFTNAGTTDLDADNSGLSTGDNEATNAAIHLITVATVTLNNVDITGGAEQGINGKNVSTFTLTGSTITNVGNAADEDNIHFFNMSGTSVITNTTLTHTAGGGDDNLNLQMQSGTLNLTISGGGAVGVGGGVNQLGSGYLFGIRGTSNATITFSSASSTTNFSGGIVADAFDTATMNLIVTNSTLSGNNDQLSVSAGDNSNVNLTATGNTLSSVVTGDFVGISLLGSAFDTGFVFDASIANNTITIANGLNADGIIVNNAGGGQMNVNINNNAFDYAGTQRAIAVQAGQDGNGTNNVTITDNNIDVKLDGVGNAVTGIFMENAVTGPPAPSNTSSMCIDIGGAGSLANVFTHSQNVGSIAGGDMRVRQRFNGTVRLPGYGGSATSTAAVVTYLNGRNTEVTSSTATLDSTGFAGGAACTQPTLSAPPSAPAELGKANEEIDKAIEAISALRAEPEPANPQATVSQAGENIPEPTENSSTTRSFYGASSFDFGKARAKAIGVRYAAKDSNAPLNLKLATQDSKLTLSDPPNAPNGAGGTVLINIGTLPANDSVTITFQVVIDNPYSSSPNVSVQGTVSGSNFSSVLTDDPAVGGATDPTLTPIAVNDIFVKDAKLAEPSSVTRDMVFTVTLANPASSAVSVNFATADEAPGAGKAVAGTCGGGGDYVATNGTINFLTGEQVKTINVPICPDAVVEVDETFLVNLSNAVGGTIQDGQAVGTITQANAAGTLLISELRHRGPGGATDEFVELYNNSNSPLIVTASDGSSGYGVFKMGTDCSATPVLVGLIPNTTNIPARGHFLLTGSSYSLTGYGGTNAALGNATLLSDIEDDRNFAVFNTSNVANISSATRLDAVGFGLNSGGVCDLLREPSTLAPVGALNIEYSYFRKQNGFPIDTNDNSSDFVFADTAMTTIAGITRQLGAPGPENLSNPIHGVGSSALPALDPTKPSAAVPNQFRDFVNAGANAPNGTLHIRRRFVNNTASMMTRLRFRIYQLTTGPTPAAGTADLRALTSSAVILNGANAINDPATCAAIGTPTTVPCQVTAQASVLETPPAQPNGGGLNATLTVSIPSGLASGQSIGVNFALGIVQGGPFTLGLLAETLPGSTAGVLVTGNTESGPTASNGTVTGRIVDGAGNPVEGTVVRLEGTQNRKFITDANGVYQFDGVATNGFYTVTPSRANYTFSPAERSFTQLGETTNAAFGATLSSSGNLLNPLDTPEYFVRQHYVDFLGREPDEAGFNFWSDQILECGLDQNCIGRRRENVSAAYFLSIEFRGTGGLVDGLYRAAYGTRPEFASFMPDTRAVGLGVVVGKDGWEAVLQANKEAFAAEFANRPAFHALYDNMDNSLFVDTLIGHTGVQFTSSERDALVSSLASGTPRAEVLRSIAENERFVSAKLNETFVMMEYFGYLRRDPDAGGFGFWLSKLNEFNGNFEQAEMVKAFIVSGEYRDRFPR